MVYCAIAHSLGVKSSKKELATLHLEHELIVKIYRMQFKSSVASYYDRATKPLLLPTDKGIARPAFRQYSSAVA
jgi:hypothetical protein